MGNKRIIGLAGAIGSGKSTVAGMLREMGCGVVGSDELAHEILAWPEVRRRLREWWGPTVLAPDGTVDRRKVAEIVFADAAERERLESLLHPLIDERRREIFARFEADDAVRAIVLDAPLLYEKGLDALCDRVIFVDATPAERLRRLATSRGWRRDEVLRREQCQQPAELKRTKADYIVDNTDVDDCRRQVDSVLTKIVTDGGMSNGQGRHRQT